MFALQLAAPFFTFSSKVEKRETAEKNLNEAQISPTESYSANKEQNTMELHHRDVWKFRLVSFQHGTNCWFLKCKYLRDPDVIVPAVTYKTVHLVSRCTKVTPGWW